MPEISIIIPIYNCEPYLKECIQSIQKQSVDLEIICIDDGSEDGSRELLEILSIEDRRIRWYRQDHAGAGIARNFGVKVSAGEYIAFLDADDYYLEKDALRRMLQRCREYGVNACGSIRCLLENQVIKETSSSQYVERAAQQGILQYKDFQLDYDFQNFIFKRSFIIDNHIKFPNYRYFEDPPFLVKTLFAMQEFVMCDVRLYCYRIKNDHGLDMYQCSSILDGIKENLLFALQNHLEKLFDKTVSRLEYEYGDKILSCLISNNVEILEKLLDINKIISRCYDKYTIRILKVLMDRNQTVEKNYEKYLKDKLHKCHSVYIYGAGAVGRKFEKYLVKIGMNYKIKGFVITDTDEKHAMEVAGLPVYEFRNVMQYVNESFLFIAVGPVYVAEIVRMLELENIKNFEIVNGVFLNTIRV